MWLIDFANVWEKMILNGVKVKKLKKLIVPLTNRSVESQSQSQSLATNKGSVSTEKQQQNAGDLSYDEGNDKNDETKDDKHYYYIGSFIAIETN